MLGDGEEGFKFFVGVREVERALTEEERKEGVKGFEFFFPQKKELHITHHYMLKGRLKRSSTQNETSQFSKHVQQNNLINTCFK